MIIHNDWKKKSYLMPVALGLLLVVARIPDLMAEGIPTNEMPTKLSELIEEANKLPLSRDEWEVFLKTRLRAMGPEGVELLIGELKKPTVSQLIMGSGMLALFRAQRARYTRISARMHVIGSRRNSRRTHRRILRKERTGGDAPNWRGPVHVPSWGFAVPP